MALGVEASGPSQVPNSHLRAIICGGMTQLERDIKVDDDDGDLLPLPRTELDSHANMVLLGKHSFIFDSIPGNKCEVVPFDPSIGSMKSVPIVDGAVAYDSPITNKTYVLLFRNALYIPTLETNLVPPFIMREAGLIVNDIPRIHDPNPSDDSHSIMTDGRDLDLRIPMSLWGIFSFFHTRVPTRDELFHEEKVFLTPDSLDWNPYSDHYARNEDSMTDFEGNLHERRYWKKHKGTETFTDTVSISAYDALADSTFDMMNCTLQEHRIPPDKMTQSMAQIATCDFSDSLLMKAEEGKMQTSIGATSSKLAVRVSELFDSGRSFDEPFTYHLVGDDLDVEEMNFEVDSLVGGPPKKLDAKFLSKIWCIKHDEAEKVLEQSTILMRQGAPNTLSNRFPTNDRAIRYKRIRSVFFTDTFFATSKAGKTTRGNTITQIFVSDKGFVAVYPMKSKGEFKDALKMFCKEVGVPMTLVCDPSGEQTSKEVKHFCHQVGMTLRVLEESTQWANRAERYVGLFKEAVCNDLRRTNSPLCLWDYCLERRARIHNVTPKKLFQLQGQNPTAATFGDITDISNICMFDWYEFCYFREVSDTKFPFQKEQLGRCLGPMKNEGNEMAQAILKMSGSIVPRRTVRRLTVSELHSRSEQ